MPCIFCEMEDSRVIDSNQQFYVIRDGYPVTEGHTLFTQTPIVIWFDLTKKNKAP